MYAQSLTSNWQAGAKFGVPVDYRMGPFEKYDADIFLHEANYEQICSYQDLQRKIYLGDNVYPKVCRFCKRYEPDVTFRKDAHAIPALIGNRYLLTNYECDECNDVFGGTFETDFATYFQAYRTLARLRGRKSFPAMKSEQDGWRVEGHSNGINVHHLSTRPLVQHDKDKKRFILSLPRGPYTPQNVYKCFLRMGLTVMPEEELQFFEEHFAWATCRPTFPCSFRPTYIWETFFNGPVTFRSTGIFLWRRINDHREIPYMTCLVFFSNSMYQFFIPSNMKDKPWMDKGTKFIFVPPHPIPAKNGVRVEQLELSGTERRQGETVEFPFKYQDHIIRNNYP